MAKRRKSHAYKTVSVLELRAADANPRTHSKKQIEQLQRSIREFGFTNPILIDESNQLIAGHGRLEAAIAEGMKAVPAIVVTGLSAVQKRALVIADNQLALNAGWNEEILSMQLKQLGEEAFDLTLIGFSERELQSFLYGGGIGRTDPDDAPEAPTMPVSAPGDAYILGRHRLLCGDATKAADVERLLASAKPPLMVTDPPYGVEYDAEWRNHALPANGSSRNGRAVGKVTNDAQVDWSSAWRLFPGDVAYCWHAGRHASAVQASLESAGFVIRWQIIWAKQQMVIGRGDYHGRHEPCWYAVRKGRKGHWSGDRKQTTLWEIDKPHKSETGHSTQKPVECMKRPIENNSKVGDAVYEPFSGSGTTIIAAEMTGRCCYAMEIEPAYVDVAVQRWEAFTGMKAAKLK